jgi:hypothetical protein
LTNSVRLNLSATHTDSYDKFEALPLGGASRRYSVGETELAWRFLENWDLATAYRFRRDDDSGGTATSNAVFATLTYRTTLLP